MRAKIRQKGRKGQTIEICVTSFVDDPQTCKNGSEQSSKGDRRSDPRGSVIVHLESGDVTAELRACHVAPPDHVRPVEHPQCG